MSKHYQALLVAVGRAFGQPDVLLWLPIMLCPIEVFMSCSPSDPCLVWPQTFPLHLLQYHYYSGLAALPTTTVLSPLLILILLLFLLLILLLLIFLFLCFVVERCSTTKLYSWFICNLSFWDKFSFNCRLALNIWCQSPCSWYHLCLAIFILFCGSSYGLLRNTHSFLVLKQLGGTWSFWHDS